MAAKFNREDVTLGALVAGRIPTNSSSTPVPTGLVSRAVDWEVLPSGTSGQVLTTNADGSIAWTAAGSGSGTVTSVSWTGDGTIFTASADTPVTTSGTLTPASLIAQAANTLLAGPGTGAAHVPTFRALVSADIPTGLTYASPTFSGAIQKSPTAVTATAGAATLNWSTGSWFVVTLVTGANTLTLSNIPAGTVRQSVVVELIQPSGGATVTWAGPTVSWGGAGAPTLSSTTGYVDVITLMNVTTSEVRAAANLGFTF
jgi:hypothetical protein